MMYVLDIFPLQNVQINFVWRINDVNTTINTHPVTNEKLIKDRERERNADIPYNFTYIM